MLGANTKKSEFSRREFYPDVQFIELNYFKKINY